MKFELSMDELVFDLSQISEQALLPVMKKAMSEILTDHGRKAGSGQQPDGTGQKANSSAYAKRKASPGIRVGGSLKRGHIPTILTGQMYASRQVVTQGFEVLGKFDGEGAIKARSLVKKGYKIHYFSQQNIDAVQQRVADELGVKMDKAITVKRK